MADKLRQELEKSLKAIISANDDAPLAAADKWFQRTGVIPDELHTNESREKEWGVLTLLGPDYHNFHKALELFEEDQESEFLSKAEHQDRMWFLFCEAYLNRNTLLDETMLKELVDIFLREVRRYERVYEVLIPIENFEILDGTLPLWDFKLEKITRESLKAKGVDINNRTVGGFFKNLSETTAMIISGKGTSPKHVCERARNKAILNLKIMQAYCSYSTTVNEQHLLFEMSEDAIVRDVASSTDVLTQWKARRKPYGFKFSHEQTWLAEKANAHRGVLENHPKLISAFERALYWMGVSLDEGDPDRKVIALCSALESMLSTKDERMKGERIAFRYCLLCAVTQRRWVWPQDVLEIYNRRSVVVHGSGLDLATPRDASTLSLVMRDVLDCFVEATDKYKIVKPTALFKVLETSQEASEFLEFLLGKKDKPGLLIAGALIEAMAKHCKA